MINMEVNIAGVRLKNPITVASGTFGYGLEMKDFMNISELGGICLKAITLEKREGNKPPRIAETPSGVLNSVGLQNPGVDAFLKYILPTIRQYDTKLIANIAGKTMDEYVKVAEKLCDSVDMLELNISCPNVKEGGVTFGTSAHMVEEITKRVKKAAKVPLMVKLSPNVTDITEIAREAEAGGADALSLINTLLGMRIDVNTRRPILSNNVGGLSGPAVKPVAVRMVYQVANAVKLPIIGMGGIMTGEDVAEFLLAGATAVSIGTANLIYPDAAVRIKKEFTKYAEDNHIKDVKDLIGKVVMN
jgi:dihydroorotate dehydrogenase (NAD+) catalytic subunit